jgi:hypothetical protein
LFAALQVMPVEWKAVADYDSQREEAERRIAARDPDDWPTVALALALGLPVWSQDRDGLMCYPVWQACCASLSSVEDGRAPGIASVVDQSSCGIGAMAGGAADALRRRRPAQSKASERWSAGAVGWFSS